MLARALLQDHAADDRGAQWRAMRASPFFVEAITARGTVKWFNAQKGFGFIQPEDGGKDVFVHISGVECAAVGSLRESQRVRYEVLATRGKQAAEHVR